MSRSKAKTPEAVPQETQETLYTRDALLRSKALAHYQQDFARVALTNDMYTLDGAKDAIEAILRR